MLPRRIAAATSLVAFSLSLIVGLQAGNTFSTTVVRALAAMACTFLVGLLLGAMAERMLEENAVATEKKLRNLQSESTAEDR